MTYTAPKTWTVNEVPKTSDINTYLRDNFNHVYGIHHGAFGSRLGTATWTSTSGTYVNWNGANPLQVNCTKKVASSYFMVYVACSAYFSTSGNFFSIGVNANGSDFAGVPQWINQAVMHLTRIEWIKVGFGSNWAAGTYTFTLRSATGGGMQQNADVNDTSALMIYEAN